MLYRNQKETKQLCWEYHARYSPFCMSTLVLWLSSPLAHLCVLQCHVGTYLMGFSPWHCTYAQGCYQGLHRCGFQSLFPSGTSGEMAEKTKPFCTHGTVTLPCNTLCPISQHHQMSFHVMTTIQRVTNDCQSWRSSLGLSFTQVLVPGKTLETVL